MKGYNVYSKIQQFRQAGFSQRQVARRLGINRKTVKRYWEMPVNEYEEMSSTVCRMQYLDKYQEQIMGWLLEFPDMTAAQVCDWLKEHYLEEISERTVSRYVKQLREEYGLKKREAPREYEAVPELPMGRQMQVDFGQKMMPNVDGGQTKIFVAAFVLSRSRYKYTQMQSRPFTSVDLVRVCHDCFRYMGGMPTELVFDQDSIVCVSENAVDIIYTYQTAKSTDLDILRDTAVQMFPERFEEKPPQLYAHQGGATAFQHHGEVTRPERTIGAVPMNQIGIMTDGMAYPY